MGESERMEYIRQKGILNMMITAHSSLRDKYSFISKLFDSSLVIAAVFLNALVFASDEFYKALNLNAESSKLGLGIVSVVLFALSILGLILNTKQKAENHSQASQQLFNLLSESRIIDDLTDGEYKNREIDSFIKKYCQITAFLVPIPSRKFNRLKSKHLRMVEFSKYISKHPNEIHLIQKLSFFRNSLKRDKNGK